jgi:hypothetical protein
MLFRPKDGTGHPPTLTAQKVGFYLQIPKNYSQKQLADWANSQGEAHWADAVMEKVMKMNSQSLVQVTCPTTDIGVYMKNHYDRGMLNLVAIGPAESGYVLALKEQKELEFKIDAEERKRNAAVLGKCQGDYTQKLEAEEMEPIQQYSNAYQEIILCIQSGKFTGKALIVDSDGSSQVSTSTLKAIRTENT